MNNEQNDNGWRKEFDECMMGDNVETAFFPMGGDSEDFSTENCINFIERQIDKGKREVLDDMISICDEKHADILQRKVEKLKPSMISLTYFNRGDEICGSDFEKRTSITNINPKFILSLSDLREFHLPFSGDYVGGYAVLTMSNNDNYYIKKDDYNDLKNKLK